MSRNRFLRLWAVAGCSVLIGAFGYAPSATAHIGASHAPFNTNRLDLLTATLLGGSQVQACFDGSVDAIVDDGSFELTGYDSDISYDSWVSSTISGADDKCVTLDGSNNPSIAQHRILKVEGEINAGGQHAVEDASGSGNTPGAVSLGGAVTPARTAEQPPVAGELNHSDAPELVTATPQSPNQVVYGFDENIDVDVLGGAGTGINADDFGFHDGNGDYEEGTGIVNVSGANVTVQFDGTPAPSGGRRFVAETGDGTIGCTGDSQAVWDRGTDPASDGVEGDAKYNVLDVVGATNSTTTAPDPTAAAIAGNNSVDYTYDEPLATGSGDIVETCFIVHEADGDIHGATGAIIQNPGTDTIVRATFDLNDQSDQIQIAGAIQGAVVSATDPTDGSTFGSFDLTDRLDPGFSDGGDLEQATADTAQNRMTYCFDTDESLDGFSVVPSNFLLLNQDGNDFAGSTFVGQPSDNCVTIGGFPTGAVGQAVAAGVEPDDVAVGDLIPGDSTTAGDYLGNRPGFTDDNDDTNSSDGGNEEVDTAFVKVGGPPPTGAPGPPAPPTPTPPAPTPPGPPTVRTGLCDPNRPTAPLAELLIGDNGPNLICGFGGDDTLRGLNGADTLKGQKDDDVHAGGRGKDSARGGPGSDTLRGGKGADTLKGGGGRDTARGGKGTDLCRAEVERGCEA